MEIIKILKFLSSYTDIILLIWEMWVIGRQIHDVENGIQFLKFTMRKIFENYTCDKLLT